MRIIFAGTPDFAAHALRALLDTDNQICAVYTQPDRPAGRGKKLTASPVKQLALQHGLTVQQPLNFKQQTDIDTLDAYQADLIIVVAYGLLLPQAVLDIPRLGCINIHASLLPRWRGAAPIQRAILAGDKQTGVCIMQMTAGLDTGPVLSKACCEITDKDTTATLHDKLADLGAKTLVATLPDIEQHLQKAEPQNEDNACYANKLIKAEAAINWQQSAQQINQQIRAFNPWPIAQTKWHDKVLRIWEAEFSVHQTSQEHPGMITAVSPRGIQVATGDGTLTILKIQSPGKRAMSVGDFLNANKLMIGDHFG